MTDRPRHEARVEALRRLSEHGTWEAAVAHLLGEVMGRLAAMEDRQARIDGKSDPTTAPSNSSPRRAVEPGNDFLDGKNPF